MVKTVRALLTCLAVAAAAIFIFSCGGNAGSGGGSSGATSKSTETDVPEFRLKFRVDAAWEAREYSMRPDTVTYKIAASLADEFVLSVLPPGFDTDGLDLSPGALETTLPKLEGMAIQIALPVQPETKVARVRPIGGAAGIEVRGANRVQMGLGAAVKFEDGVSLVILGSADLNVRSAEEVTRVFEDLLDSVERY